MHGYWVCGKYKKAIRSLAFRSSFLIHRAILVIKAGMQKSFMGGFGCAYIFYVVIQTTVLGA